MIVVNKARWTASRDGIPVAAGRTSVRGMVVVTWALLVATDLFSASSAFLFDGGKSLHVRNDGRSFEKRNDGPFSGVLRCGSLEGNGGDGVGGSSGLGDNGSGDGDPLPSSNTFMTPEEVVCTCMSYLQGSSGGVSATPHRAGLEICYNFSSDSCRMANGGSLESFFEHANNPVFRSMIGCARWEVARVGTEIPATPTRGAMQTVLIDVVPGVVAVDDDDDGAAGGPSVAPDRNDRRFLWTIVRERRPPRQGHCLVHECIAVENAFAHTL